MMEKKVTLMLKEKKLNGDTEAILNYIESFQPGDWIYPGVLHRELGIALEDVYSIMELFAENGLLRQHLEVFCINCRSFTGNIYETISEIPESMKCVYCSAEISEPLQCAIVIYKVL